MRWREAIVANYEDHRGSSEARCGQDVEQTSLLHPPHPLLRPPSPSLDPAIRHGPPHSPPGTLALYRPRCRYPHIFFLLLSQSSCSRISRCPPDRLLLDWPCRLPDSSQAPHCSHSEQPGRHRCCAAQRERSLQRQVWPILVQIRGESCLRVSFPPVVPDRARFTRMSCRSHLVTHVYTNRSRLSSRPVHRASPPSMPGFKNTVSLPRPSLRPETGSSSTPTSARPTPSSPPTFQPSPTLTRALRPSARSRTPSPLPSRVISI